MLEYVGCNNTSDWVVIDILGVVSVLDYQTYLEAGQES